MPKKKVDAIEDQRAPDQDAAIEQAFVAGTLPEEDRRTVEEILEDEALAKEMALVSVIEPVGAEVSFERARDLTTDERLDSLPVGSRVEWTKTEDGAHWTVYRGAGVAAHGEGKTLAYAIRVIGATREHDPEKPSRLILVDQHGDPIAPE